MSLLFGTFLATTLMPAIVLSIITLRGNEQTGTRRVVARAMRHRLRRTDLGTY
jgi:hypothetical protein